MDPPVAGPQMPSKELIKIEERIAFVHAAMVALEVSDEAGQARWRNYRNALVAAAPAGQHGVHARRRRLQELGARQHGDRV